MTQPKKQAMAGRIMTWVCPKECGWSRSWHDAPVWYDRSIEHPLHGKITGRQLMIADIAGHNCDEYRDWLTIRKPIMLEVRRAREVREHEAAEVA
jgi:hypothetical protein